MPRNSGSEFNEVSLKHSRFSEREESEVSASENSARVGEGHLLVSASRKRGLLRLHGQIFALGAPIAAAVVGVGWLLDVEIGWIATLLAGWTVGIAAHALSVLFWERANGEALARVRAANGEQTDTRLIELDVRPASQRWVRLWENAVEEFLLADEALKRLGSDGSMERSDLHASMQQVKELVQGQARLETALRSWMSGELEDRITEARWERDRSEDEKLREMLDSNLKMLEKQKTTVESLRKDMGRLKASVERFIITAQNVHLNATRLGTRGEQGDTGLSSSLALLEEEVRVMRQVEEELGQL